MFFSIFMPTLLELEVYRFVCDFILSMMRAKRTTCARPNSLDWSYNNRMTRITKQRVWLHEWCWYVAWKWEQMTKLASSRQETLTHTQPQSDVASQMTPVQSTHNLHTTIYCNNKISTHWHHINLKQSLAYSNFANKNILSHNAPIVCPCENC